MSGSEDRQLADVNVLFALLWTRHAHHGASQAWFAAQGHRGWATNVITQLGVLRLLTNPNVNRGAVSASTAVAALAEAMGHPNHQFWPLDRPVPSILTGATTAVTGSRQWTDLVLLRHAVERKGILVTFDGGLSALTNKESRTHLLLLRA